MCLSNKSHNSSGMFNPPQSIRAVILLLKLSITSTPRCCVNKITPLCLSWVPHLQKCKRPSPPLSALWVHRTKTQNHRPWPLNLHSYHDLPNTSGWSYTCTSALHTCTFGTRPKRTPPQHLVPLHHSLNLHSHPVNATQNEHIAEVTPFLSDVFQRQAV